MNDDGIAPDEIRQLLRHLLTCVPGFPAARYRTWGELIDAGEVTLAFEFICDQLEVYSLPITKSARASIFDLGVILGAQKHAQMIDLNPSMD